MAKLLFLLAVVGSVVYLLKQAAGAIKWMASMFQQQQARIPVALKAAEPQPQPAPTNEWSAYETPTFVRRGIPMPKLEMVQAKPKRRRKAKAEAKAEPKAVTFEIVA